MGLWILLLAAQGFWGAESVPAWKIGIWVERGPRTDSLRARAWADSLVKDFSSRVKDSARLERFTLVRPGALPLAGGDPHHHPDLRDTVLDAQWGVPYGEALTKDLAVSAERAWLSARGCPDERNFAVGWDLFLLNQDPRNKPDSLFWRVDSHNYVRYPAWSEIPDSGLDPLCRRVLREVPPGSGLRNFSVDTVRTRLQALLPSRLEVSVMDDGGRPAAGARLELWRSQADSRRTFGARLEGLPDTLIADNTGTFALTTGLAWFTNGDLKFGTRGSNALSYWRVRFGRKRLEGWMDATDLARLADDSGRARLVWGLPGGSSLPWREASAKWPHGWLAAEADSSGTLFLGLSIPEDAEYVLKILDPRGKEFLRARPVHLKRGVHERILSPNLPEGSWDVRLDGSSERWQVRLYQPPHGASIPAHP